MSDTTWIAIATFVLNLVLIAVGGTWKLSRLEAAIKDEFHAYQREVEDDIDTFKREVGETFHAIRQKLTDMELWNRDTFLRRESFFAMNKDNGEALQGFSDRMEARLLRMENKIDEIRK